MFDIEYKGGNTVVVSTKKTTVVFDPKQSLIGLEDLVVKDAVQVATEDRFAVDSDSYLLTVVSPGEFEIGDVSIRGVAATRHIDDESAVPASVVYRLEIGDVRIAVAGNVAPKLTDDQLETIGLVDVVIVPVGGNGYTLDATSAASLVRQLEPKVVVPVHYADATLKYEVQQDEVEVFNGELGAPVERVGAKYKVKSISGLPSALTIIILDKS